MSDAAENPNEFAAYETGVYAKLEALESRAATAERERDEAIESRNRVAAKKITSAVKEAQLLQSRAEVAERLLGEAVKALGNLPLALKSHDDGKTWHLCWGGDYDSINDRDLRDQVEQWLIRNNAAISAAHEALASIREQQEGAAGDA